MGHQQQNGGIDDATGQASHGGGKHQGEVELARKVDMEVGLHRTRLPAAWQWVAAWHWVVVLQRGTLGAGPAAASHGASARPVCQPHLHRWWLIALLFL